MRCTYKNNQSRSITSCFDTKYLFCEGECAKTFDQWRENNLCRWQNLIITKTKMKSSETLSLGWPGPSYWFQYLQIVKSKRITKIRWSTRRSGWIQKSHKILSGNPDTVPQCKCCYYSTREYMLIGEGYNYGKF